MTWVAEEQFESYSDEADLSGGSGGSGWSNNWTVVAGSIKADTAQASQGSVSARVTEASGTNPLYTRNLTTAISGSGTVYFSVRRTSTSSGKTALTLRNASGGGRAYLEMRSDGNVYYFDSGGTTWTIWFAYSANTWYDFKYDYDVASGTYTPQYWNGSSYTSAGAQNLHLTGDIAQIGIGGDSGSISWVDNITATDQHPGAPASFIPKIIMT